MYTQGYAYEMLMLLFIFPSKRRVPCTVLTQTITRDKVHLHNEMQQPTLHQRIKCSVVKLHLDIGVNV